MDQDKLAFILRARLSGFEQLIACERLSAGASRETYCLNARVNGAERLMALRRAAAEDSAMKQGPGLTAEADLFRAARAAGVPGPDVLVVLKPEDGLGAGFVMDWISGETLGARIARNDAFAAIRPKLARQCGEILGRLHSIDVKAAGLDRVLDRMTPEDSVRHTYATYLALDEPQPMIDFTAAWLLASLPSERPLGLVHSDFRNGNFIVDPERGVVAVLDWELAHVGDPARDLGWICTRSWRFGVADRPVGGFGDYDDLFAGYESVSGKPVDRRAVHFWEVFGSFWWAVGTLSMAQSWRDGSEPSVERPMIGRRSSECQIDCVNMIIPGRAHRPAAVQRALSAATLPRSDELLESVRNFLSGDLAKSLEGRNAFLARVAANSVDTNLVGHWRGGRVKWPCAATFALAGLAGSFAGSSLAKMIDGRQLLLAFAIAMAAIAISMFRQTRSEGDPAVHISWKLVARLAPLGLLTGLAAGFFGIGGGFLIVPGLMLATGMTITNAAASSLVSVMIFGAATSLNYAASDLVDWRIAGLLLAGGAIGGVAGLMVAKRLATRSAALRHAFASLVIVVAAYVAWKAIAAL